MRLLGHRLRYRQRRIAAGLHRCLHSPGLFGHAPHSIRAHGSDSAEVSSAGPLRRHMMAPRRIQSGQATVEYALLTAGVIVPMTFGLIYVSQLLWIWHSVADFTRDGARYASTHCWQAHGGTVLNSMKTHVPQMVDQEQLQNGPAQI